MTAHRNLNVILCIFMLLCALFSHNVSAQMSCDELGQDSHQLLSQSNAVNAQAAALENLLAQRVETNQLATASLIETLQFQGSVMQAKALLLQNIKAVQLEMSTPTPPELKPASECEAELKTWLKNTRTFLNAKLRLLKAKTKLLELPQSIRDEALLQALSIHAVSEIRATLQSYEANPESSPHALANASLLRWIRQYISVQTKWLPLLLNNAPETANQTTLGLTTLADPDQLISWSDLSVPQGQMQAWRFEIKAAYRALTMGFQIWQHQCQWNLFSEAPLDSLKHPEQVFKQIISELFFAPEVLWYKASRGTLNDYNYAQKQGTTASLLSSWILQSLALLIGLALIIKIAEQSPRQLSAWQQSSLSKVEQTSSARLLSGMFWFIKPNAPWLVVLIASNALTALAPQSDIFSWLAPLGTLYAVFRFIRVIFEWLMSRTYSRAGQFISPNAAQKISQDTRTFAVSIVFALLAYRFSLVLGGYLAFIVWLASITSALLAFQALLFRHQEAVRAFLEKNKTKNVEPSLSALAKVLYPVLFLWKHLLDSIASLNQKLLAFDTYRAFSVKLLRARLESKSEDESIEDENEPDENYSEWMLRAETAQLHFNIGDHSRALAPIQRWHSDKSDENLLLVVGDAGSGKTSFLKNLNTLWTETEVKYLSFDQKISEPDAVYERLAEALGLPALQSTAELVKVDQNLPQQVVVIDDVHNLFMAEVGQFEAYKALMQCLNAHLDQVFWVISMHAPSWSYLSCVFSRQQRITNVYYMPRWSPQEIRRLVLSRHQGSKRRLRYNELLLSASASNESSSVRGADSRVFNILWEQSHGNPTAALELWLNAVKVKGRIVEIGVPQKPSAQPLADMKDDLYFVYAAIVVHRSLSTQEIMCVTHFAEPIVRHAIKQGINLGMILRDSRGRYSVDPYWYGTLSAFLQRKNLLWN